MKTLAKIHLELVVLKSGEYLPEKLEQGKFYYSPELNGSSHLCVCGCGEERYIPIMVGEWDISINGDKFSITPSLHHRIGCKSHYIITNSVANIV